MLKEYLTGIANAIRNKKGTTEPINASNFASEIESIEAGGSGIQSKKFDFNRDYTLENGTITYSTQVTNDDIILLANFVNNGIRINWLEPVISLTLNENGTEYVRASFTLNSKVGFGLNGVLIDSITFALQGVLRFEFKIENNVLFLENIGMVDFSTGDINYITESYIEMITEIYMVYPQE